MNAVLPALLVASLLAAVAGGLAITAERLDPAQCGLTPWRRADWAFVALQPLLAATAGTAIWQATGWLAAHGLLRGALGALPAISLAPVGFLGAEVIAYMVHRAEHRLCALWTIHRLHHQPRDLDWVRGFRFNPVDTVLSQAVPLLALSALGCPVAALVPWALAATVVVLFAHSNVAAGGKVLELLVVTPAYHRAHHRPDAAVNFALVLPCIDAAFGTAAFSTTATEPATLSG